VPSLRLMPGINGIKASAERKIARRCRRNALKERHQRDHQRVLVQRSGRNQQHVVVPAKGDTRNVDACAPRALRLALHLSRPLAERDSSCSDSRCQTHNGRRSDPPPGTRCPVHSTVSEAPTSEDATGARVHGSPRPPSTPASPASTSTPNGSPWCHPPDEARACDHWSPASRRRGVQILLAQPHGKARGHAGRGEWRDSRSREHGGGVGGGGRCGEDAQVSVKRDPFESAHPEQSDSRSAPISFAAISAPRTFFCAIARLKRPCADPWELVAEGVGVGETS
jgi:hypothetical protein